MTGGQLPRCRQVHSLVTTVLALQLLRVNLVCSETNSAEAIEITEARFIASNAFLVRWETKVSLPTTAMCCVTLKKQHAIDSANVTVTIPALAKRYVFWNTQARPSVAYSVHVDLVTSDPPMRALIASYSVSQNRSIHPVEINQPVVMSRCLVNIKNGFTKELNMTGTNEIIFAEHDNITLSCDITGSPTPSIRWFKDMKTNETVSVESSLVLPLATKAHEGLYSCIADNRFGSAVFPGVHLRMAVIDQFSAIDHAPRRFTMEAGVGQTIECRYNGQSVPSPVFKWYRLRGENDRSPDPVPVDNSRVLLSITGSLVFVITRPSDTFLYMCNAWNSELDSGVSGSLTYLEVTESRYDNFSVSPMLVFKSVETQKVLIGDSASMQCIFSGRPIPSTVWFVAGNEQPINSSGQFQLKQNGTTLVINNISDSTPTQFTCEGRNVDGRRREPVQFQLLIYGKPKFIVVPRSINASIGDTVTFNYQVYGVPKPDITWSRQGRPLQPSSSVYVNDSSLTLLRVGKESASSLQLNVSNAHGYSLANVVLNVYERTVVSSVEELKDDYGIVTVRCNAETDPSTDLRIEWLHNDKPLIAPFRPVYGEPVNHLMFQPDQLSLAPRLLSNDDDDEQHEGRRSPSINFTCVASNGFSSDRRTLTNLASRASHAIHKSSDVISGVSASHSPTTYLGYAACAVVLLVIVVVAVLGLRKRRSSPGHSHSQRRRPSTAHSSSSSATMLSVKSDYDDSTISSVDNTRSLAYRSGSGDIGRGFHHHHPHHHHHHYHQHQLRCQGSRRCQEGLLLNANTMMATMQEISIPRERLHVSETFAQGRYSKVLLAFLHDPRGEMREAVAVKTLRRDLLETDTAELFLKEAEITVRFQHINVLASLGVSLQRNGGPLIVQPFMSNGDLRSYIMNPRMDMMVLHLLQIGLQVARGMVYLSSLPIVHCHLRTKACLVNSRGIVKVSDFGLTRELIMRNYYLGPEHDLSHVWRWMSLETIEAHIFTTMSDMWSFGVLLWELMTRGATPFDEVDDADVRSHIISGQTLTRPRFCPNEVYTLMSCCWNHDPLQRPNFSVAEETIYRIINSSQQGSQNPLYANLISPPNPFDDTNRQVVLINK